MRHPTLELFGLGLAGLHHQTVQTSFGDNGFIWISRNTVGNNDGILLIGIKFADRITIVRDAQHVAHVFGDEPRFAFLVGEDADLVAFEVEGLYIGFSHFGPSFNLTFAAAPIGGIFCG